MPEKKSFRRFTLSNVIDDRFYQELDTFDMDDEDESSKSVEKDEAAEDHKDLE